MRRIAVALAALALVGCAEWRLGGLTTSITSHDGSATMAEANREVAAGHERQALALYERVAKEHAGEDVAAEALHAIAVLRLEPRSPVRDRRAATQTLNRIVAEYPKTRWAREARVWRIVFQQVDRCEAEATRLGADAERMRQTLDSLRDSDLELEGGRQ